MRTENPKETFSRELPTVSPAEIARFIKQGERMRAEAQAELLRSTGRGIARLGRTLVMLLAAPRPTQGGMKNA
jgi:hypothetical protein